MCSVWQASSGPPALPALLFGGLPSKGAQEASPCKVSAVPDAVEFLRSLLADGPAPATEVQRRARQAGISVTTLQRAKRRLEVTSVKVGLAGGWVWAPSKAVTSPREDDHLQPEDDLRQDVLTLARLLGWPAVQVGPKEDLMAGERHWRAFAAGASEGRLWAAWHALIQHDAQRR